MLSEMVATRSVPCPGGSRSQPQAAFRSRTGWPRAAAAACWVAPSTKEHTVSWLLNMTAAALLLKGVAEYLAALDVRRLDVLVRVDEREERS